jgi:hypothetical protein
MNENQIADIWMLFKEYLDKKTQDVAAERFVDLLADYGISDGTIRSAAGFDDTLDDAISYYLDQDLDDTDEEETDYDYGEDDE